MRRDYNNKHNNKLMFFTKRGEDFDCISVFPSKKFLSSDFVLKVHKNL